MTNLLENHYTYEGNPVNRLILGLPKPKTEHRITIGTDTFNFPGTLTGEIGFFDYIIGNTLLPDKSKPDQIIKLRALRIPFLGIEPGYRRKGIFSQKIDELEELAKNSLCEAITIEKIENPKIFIWGNRHGYLSYWDYRNILKYLNKSQ